MTATGQKKRLQAMDITTHRWAQAKVRCLLVSALRGMALDAEARALLIERGWL